MYKIIENVYKIRFRTDYFETCNIWAKVFCPCPGAIHMYKSIEIYTRTRGQVSVYRTTGPLVFITFAEIIGFNANNVDLDQIPLRLFSPVIFIGIKPNVG